MCIITINIVWYFLFTILILCSVMYWYQTNNFNYWKVRGVPCVEPNWFFGNIGGVVVKPCIWIEDCCKYYQRFKGNGFGGLFRFRKPVFFVCDPILIEKVLVQDFIYFEDRAMVGTKETLANSLYFATGENWQNMRFRLFPTFTSMKVRGMLDQILGCCDRILYQIDRSAEKKELVEIEGFAFFFSIEAIASCAFGVQIMSDATEGTRYVETLLTVINSPKEVLARMFITETLPGVARCFGIKQINNKVTDYFLNLTKNTIQYRQQHKIKRDDILQMILSLKDENLYEKEAKYENINCLNKNKFDQSNHLPPRLKTASHATIFSEDCIASILFNFLTAGTNQSYITVSFALFEIAKNHNIQKHLQKEIDSILVKHHGWTCEAIKDMTYLDQVIQETLRLYNNNPSLMRTATKPYRVPGTNLILEKGMSVYVPISAIHLDPQYYPSPEQFNPDRFEGHNYKPTPFFMPFGYGPRICICVRFAVIMMKVFIAKIISRYTVNIRKEMKLPLKLDRNCFYLKAEGGILLSFDKRKFVI